MAVFSAIGGVLDGLSGKTAKKATSQAIAASQQNTDKTLAMYDKTQAQNAATLKPLQSQFGPATNYINQLLGLTPRGQGVDDAFNAYKKSSGYEFRKSEGERAVTNNQAVSGLLNSGSTLKALQDRGDNLASAESNNYLNALLTQQGVGAQGATAQVGVATNYANSVANANAVNASNIGNAALARGNASTQVATGILSAAGAAAGASDPRLKVAIERVGTRPDGLGEYEWTYVPGLHGVYGSGRYRGVMADEVAALRPDALGPMLGGYMTVNYRALEAA